MSFIVKDSNYDEFIRYNGERMIDSPYAMEIKEGKGKYFIITEDDKFVTDFSVFEEDDNEINLNIILRCNEVLDAIVEYLKNRYDVIKVRTVDFYKYNIGEKYNIIKTVVVDEKLDLYDYYIKLK